MSVTLLLFGVVAAAEGRIPTAPRHPPRHHRRRGRDTATPRRLPPPAHPVPPAPRPQPPPVPVTEEPTGFASFRRGPETVPGDEQLPLPDRWRAGWPRYERYPGASGETIYRRGALWNPYDLNLLKGDYPISGQHTFLVTTLKSDTLVEGHRLPVPSGVSAARPDSEPFFGQGEQVAVVQDDLTGVQQGHLKEYPG